MAKFNDLTGKEFSYLKVISRNGSKGTKAVWKCQCVCGAFKDVTTSDLVSMNTKSCGCMRYANMPKKHGFSSERLYRIYIAMRTRCRTSIYYENVSVCDEWKNDYKAFRNWALSNGYEDNLTIDRINNLGNYEPSNCRWVTMKVQAQNKRKRGTVNGRK